MSVLKKAANFLSGRIMLSVLVLLWSAIIFADVSELITKGVSVVGVIATLLSCSITVLYLLELKASEYWVLGRTQKYDALLTVPVLSRVLIMMVFGF